MLLFTIRLQTHFMCAIGNKQSVPYTYGLVLQRIFCEIIISGALKIQWLFEGIEIIATLWKNTRKERAKEMLDGQY